MTDLVPIVMFGWIPVVLLLCALLPSRRAVVASFVIAWSFLPMAQYHIEGIPAYTKMSATCGGVLLAALLFDVNKLLTFRPAMIDMPMVVWCLCPIASSLNNGLGLYDGISTAFAQTVAWGFPYFIGRLYLSDLRGLRDLAMGIFLGGLTYVPLCLYEIRMSPQLHRMVYGYHAYDFAQTMRLGGWRPTVFMEHGLMVGMWMSMASLIGAWLWWTGAVTTVWGMPILLPALALIVTAVLCKSLGAIILLCLGVVALATIKWFGTRGLVYLMIAILPLYVALRAPGIWSGSQMSDIANAISSDRSQSLDFRLLNENILADRALQQPIFGWGGWGRAQIIQTNFRTIVDGQWIDVLGKYGFVGLISFAAAMLVPPLLLLKRVPVRCWMTAAFAPAGALLIVNVLYMIDNIPNAMINPIYVLAGGGLAGLLVRPVAAVSALPARRPRVRAANAPRRFVNATVSNSRPAAS